MLKSTSCNIHTFDCTFEGKSIHPERHTYHQWCFGNGAGRYRTWSNITQTLGHDYIDLLKMDIGEGAALSRPSAGLWGIAAAVCQGAGRLACGRVRACVHARARAS